MRMYVWLDIQTGKFSNSWTEEEHQKYFIGIQHIPMNSTWKLISYECVNDKEFIFNDRMKIK
jgi:hypothetical protein